MPNINSLRLEDVRDDCPQARSMLGLFVEDTAMYTNYVSGLLEVCQKVVECENAMSVATQSLTNKLDDFGQLRFPLGRDDTILTSTLKQFATTINELSAVHATQASQMSDQMVQPLASFCKGELTDITNKMELTRVLEQEHEQAVSKYCRISKKKENETKARIDSTEELHVCRKKLLLNSLNYYKALNLLQYKRSSSLLEPMLGYFQAQLTTFKLGKETLSRQLEQYLSDITESVQNVHSEISRLSERSTEQAKEIQNNSAYYCVPEPTPDMLMEPRPVNVKLSQIAGYLMIRSKSSLTHRWDRQYFFTQGGNLMSNAKDQIAGSLVINLDGCTVSSVDIDDRRFVFQITRPEDVKKSVSLQCLSNSDREEWVSTVRNVSRGFHMNERSSETNTPQTEAVDTDYRARTLSAPVAAEPVGQIPSGKGENSLATTVVGGTRPKQASVPQGQRAGSYVQRERTRSVEMSDDAGSHERPSSFHSSLESVLTTTPIQFDMISPSEPEPTFSRQIAPPVKDGVPQRRVNPFGETNTKPQMQGIVDSTGFYQTYVLRFLGTMEVQRDKGWDIIMDTIRQIIAARAIHNVFKMTEVNLVINSKSLILLDSARQLVKAQYNLIDVSFWAAHQENKRLFAFITSSKSPGVQQQQQQQPQFLCHVFECDVGAEEICRAISLAAEIAFNAMLQQRKTVQAQEFQADEPGGGDYLAVRTIPNLDAQPIGMSPSPQMDTYRSQSASNNAAAIITGLNVCNIQAEPSPNLGPDNSGNPSYNTNKNNNMNYASSYDSPAIEEIILDGSYMIEESDA